VAVITVWSAQTLVPWRRISVTRRGVSHIVLCMT
jgi:hypothetical protein